MEQTQRNIVTKVSVQGVAEGKYDVVTFTLTTSADGQSPKDAREALRPRVVALKQTIDSIEEADIPLDKEYGVSSTACERKYQYDRTTGENKSEGFTARYIRTFAVLNVEKASEVQDILMGLDDIESSPPNFRINNITDFLSRAFKDARAKVEREFAEECTVLGLQRGDYEIVAWDKRNDLSQSHRARPESATGGRAMMAVAASASNGGYAPIDINPGLAQVFVSLSVSFAKKETTVARAPRDL